MVVNSNGRDNACRWMGYVGYLCLGVLAVIVVPFLYPPCKWYLVAASVFIAPSFSLLNAYSAGLTDWDQSSLFGKLGIFFFAAWAGGQSGGVIAGLAVCGILINTTGAASGKLALLSCCKYAIYHRCIVQGQAMFKGDLVLRLMLVGAHRRRVRIWSQQVDLPSLKV